MMKFRITLFVLCFLGLHGFSSFNAPHNNLDEFEISNERLITNYINSQYESLIGEKPSFSLFEKGIKGFIKLTGEGEFENASIITLIDFRLPSTNKRLWVIDLKKREVLIHSVVAHGRNSGNLMAEKFSNTPESYQSSLGFYKTANIYQGKHGVSLRLDGLQKGLNDKAMERAIVIHGADYATEEFAQQNGRLGRSLGCPAVPNEIIEPLINTIANNQFLFIYSPNEIIDNYLEDISNISLESFDL
jgi:hypothetical protein